MWIVELTFGDESERLTARPAHRDRLAGLHERGRVRMAGPYADDSGALIVFDVPDRQSLDALLAADPYLATAGVTVAGVRDWRPFLT